MSGIEHGSLVRRLPIATNLSHSGRNLLELRLGLVQLLVDDLGLVVAAQVYRGLKVGANVSLLLDWQSIHISVNGYFNK